MENIFQQLLVVIQYFVFPSKNKTHRKLLHISSSENFTKGPHFFSKEITAKDENTFEYEIFIPFIEKNADSIKLKKAHPSVLINLSLTSTMTLKWNQIWIIK